MFDNAKTPNEPAWYRTNCSCFCLLFASSTKAFKRFISTMFCSIVNFRFFSISLFKWITICSRTHVFPEFPGCYLLSNALVTLSWSPLKPFVHHQAVPRIPDIPLCHCKTVFSNFSVIFINSELAGFLRDQQQNNWLLEITLDRTQTIHRISHNLVFINFSFNWRFHSNVRYLQVKF